MQLLESSQQLMQKVNIMLSVVNRNSKGNEEMHTDQKTLHKVLILKESVNEIVGCQMAEGEIINSNLLDKEELNQVLAEM